MWSVLARHIFENKKTKLLRKKTKFSNLFCAQWKNYPLNLSTVQMSQKSKFLRLFL